MTSLALLLALLLPSLAQGAQPSSNAPAPYFQMADAEKRVLAERATRIKVGESYEGVIRELGKPTVDQLLARKEDAHPIGRSLKYYAVIQTKGLVNELDDELVSVFIDEHDRVASVHIRLTLRQ